MAQPDGPETTKDMFCHAVYTSWHVINQSYKSHLKRIGLTYPQYITLTLLWERDHRNVGNISTCLEMETSTLTPLLKRLESMGYVARKRRKDDERQVTISLTAEGRALQSEAAAITACMIRDTGLSEEKLTDLVGALENLRNGLKQNAAR